MMKLIEDVFIRCGSCGKAIGKHKVRLIGADELPLLLESV